MRFCVTWWTTTTSCRLVISWCFEQITSGLRPEYLAWAINQDPFQALIDSVSSGTAVPQITKSNLAELSIDVPEIQTQDRIVAIDVLMKRERALMQTLRDRRTALLRAAARGQVA